MVPRGRGSRRSVVAIATLISIVIGWTPAVHSQELPSTSPEVGTEQYSSQELDERIRRLEQINRELIDRYESIIRRDESREERYRELEEKYNDLLERLEEPEEPPLPEPNPTGESESESEGHAEVSGEPEEGLGCPEEASEAPMLIPEPGRDYPSFEGEEAPPLRGRLRSGFELVSPDEEFSLGIRLLNQVDFKTYAPNDLNPAIAGLFLPRTRFYFEGNLTRPLYYELSLQRSVEGEFDLLDAYLSAKLTEGFQVKFGRMLVPYSYDWYDHLEPYFITPERSLFPLNLGLSRQAGLMAFGYLNEQKLEYAVGGFAGGRLGVTDDNITRDAVGYVNWRPFLDREYSPFQYLAIGGSIGGGQQVRLEPEPPPPLLTSIQATEIDASAREASVSFLEFEEDVRTVGDRFQGALHMAYYGGGLSVEAEVQAGEFEFAKAGLPTRVLVPAAGYHVTASYFLTGEEFPGRVTVVPNRPFSPRHGHFGPGALEPFARISQFTFGDEIFEFELANEEHWTNNASLVDLGFNWYPNRFVKFYFDWQHAFFGSPVLVNEGTGLLRRSADLFWIRCQVWF